MLTVHSLLFAAVLIAAKQDRLRIEQTLHIDRPLVKAEEKSYGSFAPAAGVMRVTSQS